MDKRGLTYQQAMEYVGVKRRTFDEVWRPRLVAIPAGACLIFDRQDLDRVFDEFKTEAANPEPAAQNARRNGRPIMKGEGTWAKRRGASTPTETAGKSISGGERRGFASAVSEVLGRRKVG